MPNISMYISSLIIFFQDMYCHPYFLYESWIWIIQVGFRKIIELFDTTLILLQNVHKIIYLFYNLIVVLKEMIVKYETVFASVWQI